MSAYSSSEYSIRINNLNCEIRKLEIQKQNLQLELRGKKSELRRILRKQEKIRKNALARGGRGG